MKRLKNIETDIFERFRSGIPVPMNDPGYGSVREAVNQTRVLLNRLNSADSDAEIRVLLGKITGKKIDDTTTIFTPFYTNVGRHITLGKNVFINHTCSFLDLGGIIIEDDVLIGPRVTISSENHPVSAVDRKTLVPSQVVIKKNAWLGAGAIILPGVTVGENSVVAAGAVVNKDVPPDTLVGGVPAKQLKSI